MLSLSLFVDGKGNLRENRSTCLECFTKKDLDFMLNML